MIRPFEKKDLDAAAAIHKAAFTRQIKSKEWLACALGAYPRTLSYVLEEAGGVAGYIIWVQKSGFRPEVVLELEQIAIAKSKQNKGLGQHLIKESLQQVKTELKAQGSCLKHILVSTRADNHAQQLYRKVLGAEVEATLTGLFSADEVYMIARNVGD